MGAALGAVAGTALSDAVNEGMGLLFANSNNVVQQHQQQALNNINLGTAEQFSQFNTQQQLDLWQQTNYPAQVQQLQQAGLNPALLYAKGGMGGTTGSPTGSMPQAQAPGTALPQMNAMAMNLASQQADINLKDAQAKNIEAQTPQEGDLMKSQISSLTQGVQNMKATQILTQLQSGAQEIQNNIQGKTQDDTIAQIKAYVGQVESESQQAVRNNYIDANTMDAKIQTIRGIMIGTFLQNENTRSQTKLTNEQITNITNQIQQNWKQIDINQQNVNVNKQDINVKQGQLKLNQFVNDLPIGDQIMKQGLMKLIPSLSAGAYY